MDDQELLNGIFRPQNERENNRCWREVLPYVSDDDVLSPEVEKRVIDIIGMTLKSYLNYNDSGSNDNDSPSPREYYRDYQSELWMYLKRYAITYNNNITDMKGFHAFLKQYVEYFALDKRKDELKERYRFHGNNSSSMNDTPVLSDPDDEEPSGDNILDTLTDESDDNILDALTDEVGKYVGHLNPNEVMARYLDMAAKRIEQKVESEYTNRKTRIKKNDENYEEKIEKIEKEKEEKKAQYKNYINDLYDFYVRGLTLEELAIDGHVDIKYMGVRLERARMHFVEFILPIIRQASREHFSWLKKQYLDKDNTLLTLKETSLLDYFFVERLDLLEIGKKMHLKANLRETLYRALRKYYKIKVNIYKEHQRTMRGAKSLANIDICTFEQSLINKK